MNKRAHLIITGRVQGVFFRACAAREAARFKLGGIARNLNSGDVEVILEGDESSIETMIAWCRKGPPSAQVRNVLVEWADATGQYSGFECG